MKKVRWGIIGCGNVTEVKSGPAMQLAQNSQLIAVMRRNGELAKDYAMRHGVPKFYDDVSKLINDPEVDAVYVATPPDGHRDFALMAMQAGKPVYVEKPMARTHAECQAMIDAAKRLKIPLFVAYYRRKLPRFLKIKELLDGGMVGDVQFCRICLTRPMMSTEDNLPWRVMPQIAGGGIFFDLASHTLDILDYLLGPVQKTIGFATNRAGMYPAEDTVSASFVLQSGVHMTGAWSFGSYNYFDSVEIVGNRGKLSFSTFGDEPIELVTDKGKEQFEIKNPLHIQQPLIQSIVDELLGVGKCPSTGESAARTSLVMDEIVKEYREMNSIQF